VTVREVAEHLELSETAVRRLIAAGTLPHHKFGGAIRITAEDMREFLDATKGKRTGMTPKAKVPRKRFVLGGKIRNII
jgi:excisionase family DNA binding protein